MNFRLLRYILPAALFLSLPACETWEKLTGQDDDEATAQPAPNPAPAPDPNPGPTPRNTPPPEPNPDEPSPEPEPPTQPPAPQQPLPDFVIYDDSLAQPGAQFS